MKIIDIHTHAFPDSLAPRAISALEERARPKGGDYAHHDGTTTGLLASMDRAEIQSSVICSIATQPKQFQPILDWSLAIQSPRLIPFASVHPDDPDALAHIDAIADAGIKGIKLHPYYQDFVLDDRRMYPLYERFCQRGLIVLSHTGFDIGFPETRIADPVRTAAVIRDFPELTFIAAHFGAWQDWDEVERHLIGRPVYLDLAYALPFLDKEKMARMMFDHDSHFLLFGTDSPWADQHDALSAFFQLEITEMMERDILFNNARKLLGLPE